MQIWSTWNSCVLYSRNNSSLHNICGCDDIEAQVNLRSCLFFAQMLFITNHLPPLRPLSDTVNLFYRIHAFIVGFFSMFFFYLDELSFCLWSGITTPQVITFYFVTTLFSLLLLVSFVVIVHHKSQSLLMHCSCLKNIVQKMNNLHDSLVHGLSAFFILLHSQYTLLSFMCLTKFKRWNHRKNCCVGTRLYGVF